MEASERPTDDDDCIIQTLPKQQIHNQGQSSMQCDQMLELNVAQILK